MADPMHGIRATQPGKNMLLRMVNRDTRMRPMPAALTRLHARSLLIAGTTPAARQTPMPSSQARAGSRKNATDGLLIDNQYPRKKLATVPSARSHLSGSRNFASTITTTGKRK